MCIADTLIVLGLATTSLGTIHEAAGVQSHTFWLRNEGASPVVLQQAYTSCGCTSVDFTQQSAIAVGDSTAVTLRFNPRGKGGEFMETATLLYSTDSDTSLASRKSVQMTLVGHCISSEETLLQQFPIAINDSVRISRRQFDLGVMRVGETRERHVAVLHRNDSDRQELLTIRFTVDDKRPKGVQHIDYPLTIGNIIVPITLSLLIK